MMETAPVTEPRGIHRSGRRWGEAIAVWLTFLANLCIIVPVILILALLVVRGGPGGLSIEERIARDQTRAVSAVIARLDL